MTTPRREWKLARRTLALGGRTLVMGVLNVTPDSFSDGGQFFDLERAVARATEMLADGADIIDIGGESTRPGGAHITPEEELRRIAPVVERLGAQLPQALISVDTTKAEVARAALDAGAEIVNDISALRFDASLADEAARTGAGLVLMHSRGTPATLHSLPPVADILPEVLESLRRSIAVAVGRGVAREQIAIDPGIGFGKSQQQNLELLAKLDALAAEFAGFPLLVGTSRKSFIGRLLGDAPPERRLHGTMASVTAAILGGAHIVRVHDVRAAVETARIADAIRAVNRES
ncbi:MAG TPA: dihydropteroate synthase [Pyrinomonadaceae bacterium]|jgi:dihydropteroate synthase|nr:dihydropteroate synthase [Pyrinomonadaceae bacterium]